MRLSKMAFYILASLCFAVLICHMVISYLNKSADLTPPSAPPQILSSSTVGKWSGLIYEEEELSIDTIEEQLKDTGFLITYEYLFTDLINYSSAEKLFGFIPSVSSYSVSYDGHVSAGIDFSKVTVTKDNNRLIITLPKAEIKDVVIDPSTMQTYTEKQSIGNPITIDQFNDQLVNLQQRVLEKANNHNITDLASKNAETIVENMVRSILYAQGINYAVTAKTE